MSSKYTELENVMLEEIGKIAIVSGNAPAHTMGELAELVEEREGDLAPGSETILLGDFVNRFGHTQAVLEDRPDDPVDDAEYDAWEEAYDRMEKFEADGTPYQGDDLF